MKQQNQRLSTLSAQLRRETDKSQAELQRKVSGTNLSSEMIGSKKYPTDLNRFTDDVLKSKPCTSLSQSKVDLTEKQRMEIMRLQKELNDSKQEVKNLNRS